MSNRVTPKRFGIGSPEWTGLSKVGEEAAEVIQEVMKIIATGGKLVYANGHTLDLKKLFGELGDLQAAMDFFMKHYIPSGDEWDEFASHRDAKLAAEGVDPKLIMDDPEIVRLYDEAMAI